MHWFICRESSLTNGEIAIDIRRTDKVFLFLFDGSENGG